MSSCTVLAMMKTQRRRKDPQPKSHVTTMGLWLERKGVCGGVLLLQLLRCRARMIPVSSVRATRGIKKSFSLIVLVGLVTFSLTFIANQA